MLCDLLVAVIKSFPELKMRKFELVSEVKVREKDENGIITIVIKTKVITNQDELNELARVAEQKKEEVKLVVRTEPTEEQLEKPEMETEVQKPEMKTGVQKPEMMRKDIDFGEITDWTENMLAYAKSIENECQPGKIIAKDEVGWEFEVTGLLHNGKLIGWGTY